MPWRQSGAGKRAPRRTRRKVAKKNETMVVGSRPGLRYNLESNAIGVQTTPEREAPVGEYLLAGVDSPADFLSSLHPRVQLARSYFCFSAGLGSERTATAPTAMWVKFLLGCSGSDKNLSVNFQAASIQSVERMLCHSTIAPLTARLSCEQRITAPSEPHNACFLVELLSEEGAKSSKFLRKRLYALPVQKPHWFQ
jgi:hypothetical protein